jgi:hypothetical protein
VKRLYLHIGYPKTATTSIQTTLMKNHQLLDQKGYFYSRMRGMGQNSVLRKFFGNQQGRDEVVVGHMQRLSQEVKQRPSSHTILSGESIVTWDRVHLEALKRFILDDLEIDEVIIVVSVRERVSHMISLMQQKFKEGTKHNTRLPKGALYSQLQHFIDLFGKEGLRVYKFEEALKDPLGPVGYFCRTVDMPNELIECLEIKKNNEGISDKAIDLIRFINKHAPMIVEGRLGEGRRHDDTNRLHTIRGEKFRLETKIQQRLIEESREDRAWLNEQFGILYEDPSLKEPSAIIYDDAYYEDIVAIYAKLSPTIQELTARYIKVKLKSVEDPMSQATLKRLHQWIKRFDGRLSPLFNLFEQEQKPSSIEIYRALAKMCEREGRLEIALYYMDLALKLKPNSKNIQEKIEAYQKEI